MKKKKKKAPRPNHEQKEGQISHKPGKAASYRIDGDCLRFLWDFPTYTVSKDTPIFHVYWEDTPTDRIPILFGGN